MVRADIVHRQDIRRGVRGYGTRDRHGVVPVDITVHAIAVARGTIRVRCVRAVQHATARMQHFSGEEHAVRVLRRDTHLIVRGDVTTGGLEGHDARVLVRVRGGQDTVHGDVTTSHPRQRRANIGGAKETHVCIACCGVDVTTSKYTRGDLTIALGRSERDVEQHIAASHDIQVTRVTSGELHIKLFTRAAAERYIASIRLQGYVRSRCSSHINLTAAVEVDTTKTVHKEVVLRVVRFIIEVLSDGYRAVARLDGGVALVAREFDFSLLIESHGACTLH